MKKYTNQCDRWNSLGTCQYVICKEEEKIIKLIVDNGLTGEAGDARIAVTDLKAAYRLVTKDEKDELIDLSK